MPSRSTTSAVCAALAAIALTAACAPGSSSSDDSSSSSPKTIDTKRLKGKTITYVYFTDGPDEQATRTAISKFEKETGAKVNLQILPFADINTSLQARLSSGAPPEAARVADWHLFADEAVDFKQYFGKDYPSQFTEGAA